MPVRFSEVRSQKAALNEILKRIHVGSTDPDVRRIALLIVSDCDSKDDLCEAHAIFDAVKYGTDKVPFLRKGFRYVADPRAADFYMGVKRILTDCSHTNGRACAGDCDDHSILVGSLAASIGFKVGVRAWGPNPANDYYTHVYPIIALPKRGPWPSSYKGHGMDTTVKESTFGWEPPKKRIMTAWLEEEA